MNTFGTKLRLTTFGESHGPAVGGVLDGFPAGFRVDFAAVERDLAARRPCRPGETARREPDHVEWLSGLIDGTTLGTPIAFLVRNTEARPEDYDELGHIYRPSTADLAYEQRYGTRDPRGGGRASARETVARVIAGSLACQWLAARGVEITTRVSAPDVTPEGDSSAGEVHCSVTGLRAGLGEPLFGKVQARLAWAIMSIPACHSFSYGAPTVGRLGSEYNDPMTRLDGRTVYLSNNAGGLLGGITTGEELYFEARFKPTPSIRLPQQTVDTAGRPVEIVIHGRHDRCVARRAAAVVRAMTALCLTDFYL